MGNPQARVMAACCGTPVEIRGPIDHLLRREAAALQCPPRDRDGSERKKRQKKDMELGRKGKTQRQNNEIMR